MKVLVTGASSFVGAHFCTLAARRSHDVIGLWRRTPLQLSGVRSLQGDVGTLIPPAGVDLVVHAAAKVMADDAHEQNRRMLDAILSWRIPVVYLSSTVVHWPVQNAYARSRLEDEARVRAGKAPWIIVRPCAPYGPIHGEHRPAHRESFHTLTGLIYHLPVVPVIGSGKQRRQPVHVHDFANAILNLVQKERWNNAFDSGGPEAMSLTEVIHLIAASANRKVRVLPVPVSVAERMARFVPGFHPDVIRTFDTDDVVDHRPLALASGVEPRHFRDGADSLIYGV